MNIQEKFELSDGVTILACAGCDAKHDVVGRRFNLVFRDEVRQTLTISGERKMLNQQSAFNQRAFETTDVVLLSKEEARSGKWQLIGA